MQKNIKKTVKITKKDKKISDLVSKFIVNNKKFTKLEAKRQALVEKFERKRDAILDKIDHIDLKIQDIQFKLEKLGIDFELMDRANGNCGYDEMVAAIKQMKKLILRN